MKPSNTTIKFPEFSGIRCLMMPYIQGDSTSVLDTYAPYRDIIESAFLQCGDIGFLTIDESIAVAGTPHRGQRARYARAIHTEVGIAPDKIYCWGGGGGGWGKPPHKVTLDRNVKILLANNLDSSCAVWNTEHTNTSIDGDIGYAAAEYPYKDAVLMQNGEIREMGILTPHESIPVKQNFNRQFLRIISSGVHGREEYFTQNPILTEKIYEIK